MKNEYFNQVNIARAYEVAMAANVKMYLAQGESAKEDHDQLLKVFSKAIDKDSRFIVGMNRISFDDVFSRRKICTIAEIESRAEKSMLIELDSMELSDTCMVLFKVAYDRLNLPACLCGEIITVAAAIAKLDFSKKIKTEHLAEAIHYYANLPEERI
jgi:hypothetical protein